MVLAPNEVLALSLVLAPHAVLAPNYVLTSNVELALKVVLPPIFLLASYIRCTGPQSGIGARRGTGVLCGKHMHPKNHIVFSM